MRNLFLALSVLAVALAGCSDPVPSGEAASTGPSIPFAATVASFESQGFEPGAPDPVAGEQPCPADEVPQQEPDPVADQRCQRPYTKMTLNFTTLPDPQGSSYTVVINGTDGNREELGTVAGHVHPTTNMYMAEDFVFDNSQTATCRDATQSAPCDLTENFQEVQLFLGDVLVASAPLTNGAAFALDPALLGASFTAEYSGKDLTMQVSGLGPYTYEGWLVYTDEAGAHVHDVDFTVQNGEVTYTAERDIVEYDFIHIHVAGTKLNVAVAPVAA